MHTPSLFQRWQRQHVDAVDACMGSKQRLLTECNKLSYFISRTHERCYYANDVLRTNACAVYMCIQMKVTWQLELPRPNQVPRDQQVLRTLAKFNPLSPISSLDTFNNHSLNRSPLPLTLFSCLWGAARSWARKNKSIYYLVCASVGWAEGSMYRYDGRTRGALTKGRQPTNHVHALRAASEAVTKLFGQLPSLALCSEVQLEVSPKDSIRKV